LRTLNISVSNNGERGYFETPTRRGEVNIKIDPLEV
jgi:hypothetical protein